MTAFWRRFPAAFYCGLVLVFGAPLAAAAAAATGDADVARIEAYLNAISTVEARFTQTNPDGTVVGGEARLSRPGKMRLDYDPPSPIQVIADGQYLIYYDSELKQASWLGLDETLAGILVRPNIALNGSQVKVTAVERAAERISLHLEQAGKPEQGEMIMTFDREPLLLRQWIVKDQQGNTTTVVLSDIKTGIRLSKDLFVFENPEFSDPLSRGRGR